MSAQRIADAGTNFGIGMLAALEAEKDASWEGRKGMNWGRMVEQFEIALDRDTDNLMGTLTESGVDLFLSRARLTFYGIHAKDADLRKWRNREFEAFAAVARDERVSA
jgi:hypothetical protein